jgi:hypothetical protein
MSIEVPVEAKSALFPLNRWNAVIDEVTICGAGSSGLRNKLPTLFTIPVLGLMTSVSPDVHEDVVE